MLQKEKASTLLQIGAGLAVIGLLVKMAVYFGPLLNRFAGTAIVAGILMVVIALVVPGRRRY